MADLIADHRLRAALPAPVEPSPVGFYAHLAPGFQPLDRSLCIISRRGTKTQPPEDIFLRLWPNIFSTSTKTSDRLRKG